MGKKKDAAKAAADAVIAQRAAAEAERMAEARDGERLREARAHAATIVLPKAKRVPLFAPDDEGREHLRKHHGIDVADQRPQLLTAIHQADHFAAGIGGRPLVVRHYHTADVKRKAHA